MNLGEMTAVETAEAVRTGKISALEVCDATIDRIEAADGPINAVVVRDFDRARAAAKALDANGAKGSDKLLIGVSMTVKESNNVAGLPTTWGFPDHAIKASTGNAFTRSSTPSTEPASSSRSDQTAGRTGIGPLSSMADGGVAATSSSSTIKAPVSRLPNASLACKPSATAVRRNAMTASLPPSPSLRSDGAIATRVRVRN